MSATINSKRLPWVSALWLLAIATFYFLRRSAHYGLDIDLSLPSAQLVVLPFVLVALWHTTIFGYRPPRVLIAGAALIVFATVAYSSLISGKLTGDVVLARFYNDKRESLSIRFAELIKMRRGPYSPSNFSRYKGSFKTQADVVASFGSLDRGKLIIWGDADWVNISEPKLSADLQSIKLPLLGNDELLMVASMPMVGMRYQPANETAQFVSEIISARSFPAGSALQETAFRAAGGIAAPWTLYMNRAYAWWSEGNIHLNRAISSGQVELAELECANTAYKIAKNLLAANNHPELFAAVLNNDAIANYIRGRLTGDSEFIERALSSFRGALKERKDANLYGLVPRAPLAAKINYRLLRFTYGLN